MVRPSISSKQPIRFYRFTFIFILLLALTWLSTGCVAKVQIPAIDQIQITSGGQKDAIDADTHGKQLLTYLHQLLKGNEGVDVPLCTASKTSRQCLKDGISVFVLGGVIPGAGKRTHYVFSDIVLGENQLEFTKDNSGTTFIGTPMFTRESKCQANVKDGGLQVQMHKYYATWAGIGHMYMAEGWAIDFLDMDRGLVGMQLELDIKGYATTGGGSRYVLLKFPNVPESNPAGESLLNFSDRK